MKDLPSQEMFGETAEILDRLDQPATFIGFRIAKIELRNFGTYHGPATRFEINCAGSIFAGQNGAGKSTAYDAMNVAFAVNPRLNNAAGGQGEKNERSINTYYEGIVGDEEGRGGDKKKTLRVIGNQDTTMGILVTFKNAKGDTFTAIRLLYIDAQAKRNWQYVTSHQDLSLDIDFPTWESFGQLRKRGIDRGFAVHQTFEAFMGDLAKVLGLKDSRAAQRAFQLQSLAASLQVIGTTTDFVRKYMLPDDNFISAAEETVGVINSHRISKNKIDQAQAKITDLTKIAGQIDALETIFSEENMAMRARSHLATVDAYCTLALSRKYHAIASAKHTAEQAKLEQMNQQEVTLSSQKAALDQLISAADGDRIDTIIEKISQKTLERDRRSAIHDDVRRHAEDAGFGSVSFTEAGWKEIKTFASDTSAFEEERARLNSQRDDAIGQRVTAKRTVDEIERDIIDTRKSGSPIKPDLIRVRNRIADATGLEPSRLPFLGELLQVNPKWRATWEGAANRVLGSQAVRILVPESHYDTARAALEALDERDLKDRILLENMSCERLSAEADRAAKSKIRSLGDKVLAGRIDVKADHEFATWAYSVLAHNAMHACVEGDAFAKTRGKSVTAKGSISHSDNSAERDGRSSINSRSSYVLGWSVEERIAALEEDLEKATGALNAAIGLISQLDDGIARFTQRINACRRLQEILRAPWSDVETEALSVELKTLSDELASIQTDDMKNKRRQRDQLADSLIKLMKDIKEQNKTVGERAGAMKTREDSIKSAQKQLKATKSNAGVKITVAEFMNIRQKLIDQTKPVLTGGNFVYDIFLGKSGYRDQNATFDGLRGGYDTERDTKLRARNKIGADIERLIGIYFDAHDGERSKGLSSNIRSNDETGRFEREQWRLRLNAIKAQELPAAQEEAREFRKNTLRANMSTLRQININYDKAVRDTINGVNRTLAKHIYNPSAGTHAKIHIKPSNNPYIREFEELLSAALDNHTDIDEDEQFDRIVEIGKFLTLDGSEMQGEKRRNIEILANRWDATIREIRICEDGTEELVRKIDSAGALSGGEKERFSAFLMGVAVNCAFNAHDDMVSDQCLHTILIDEAFSKSDGDTTKAAIEVLNAFNLQVIAATPMAKIRPFEPVAKTVYMIARPDNMQTAVSRMQITDIDFVGSAADDSDLDTFSL